MLEHVILMVEATQPVLLASLSDFLTLNNILLIRLYGLSSISKTDSEVSRLLNHSPLLVWARSGVIQ